MDFVLSGVTSFINKVSIVLGGWSFTHNLGADVAKISTYLDKANYLLPVDTALTVLGLFISLQLVLIAYYFITRAINLIRGAG